VIQFRVSRAAADYIRQYWQTPGDVKQLVVVIQAELAQSTVVMDGSHSLDAIVDHGRKFFESLPSRLRVRWSIGAAQRNRFPDSDIHVVDGVLFYLPAEMISLIGNRELILDSGELRFEAKLEPFTVER
jgi:hypothetical protein